MADFDIERQTMKPGPKPKSPDGHPKARYHTRLATDLIAFLRTLPNAAEWLDGVIRAGDASSHFPSAKVSEGAERKARENGEK